MTNRQLTGVAIKVFAIFVLMKALLSVPMVASTATRYLHAVQQGPVQLILWSTGAAAILILIAIAFGLWKLASNVIQQASHGDAEPVESVIDANLLVSLLGLYVFVDGLRRFGYSSIDTFWRSQHDDIALQSVGYIVVAVIQLLIGISLMIRTQGWLSLLERLRRVGLNAS